MRGRGSDQTGAGDHHHRHPPLTPAGPLTGYHLVDHRSPHVSHVLLAWAGRSRPW